MEVIEIIGFKPSNLFNKKIPIFEVSVSAGIPIPIDNEIKKEIDLNEFLIEHPATTFFARVSGLNMQSHGIRDNDILIVDSSVIPSDGKIVLTSIENELSVKIFREIDGEIYLESNNKKFLPLHIGDKEFNIIGTVTKIIRSF